MKLLSKLIPRSLVGRTIMVLVLLSPVVGSLYILQTLPPVEVLRDVRFQVPLQVYTQDNRLIAEYGSKKRTPVNYQDIPPQMVNAVLSAEDDRFFEHPGVDYQGIARAILQLIKTRQKSQGGSTITMQVARNFFLSSEKTYLRKINEIFLALKIEQELTKQQILELYFNKIYLGNRAYGVVSAAQIYYGKKLNELTLAEIAMVAGLPKAPSRYNPIANPERALIRRNYVLNRMRTLGFISVQEYVAAKAAPVTSSLHKASIDLEAPYIGEMVRSYMYDLYGDDAYTNGFQVYVTIDSKLQDKSQDALRTSLLTYDRRHGYRGPVRHIDLEQAMEKALKEIEERRLALAEEAAAALAESGATEEELPENPAAGETMNPPEEVAAEAETQPAAPESELSAEEKEIDPTLLLGTFSDLSSVGGLRPALVYQVYEQSALAILGDGSYISIPWEGLSWAAPYINVNQQGNRPTTAEEVLDVGDLVYVEPVSEGVGHLAQIPTVAGALVALNPTDGGIIALSGGFDFFHSKFNRANQAKRQPGSSFKPFVYSAALEKGFTAASIINDAPVVFDDPGLEASWRPENYSGKFYGPTRLRLALIKSRNLVSIRLLQAIGINYTIGYASRFGFDTSRLPRDLSLSLGSAAITPLEMATAYTVFANGGYKVEPYFINRIEDNKGNVLFEARPLKACPQCEEEEQQQAEAEAEEELAPPLSPVGEEPAMFGEAGILADVEPTPEEEPKFIPAERVITPQNAYLITTMMRDVVKYGTGRRALVLKRDDLAGKTGTTNDQRDAWFTGFNGDIVTIAWTGFDDASPLGDYETGAKAALPMWIDFMGTALAGKPETPLIQPPGLVTVRIDPATGLLADTGQKDAIFETFRADKVPTQKATTVEDSSTINQEEGENSTSSPELLF